MSVPRLTQLLDNIIINYYGTNSRIKIRQRDDYIYKSAEYAASQTALSLVAAPGEGKRIVVKTVAFTGDGATGEAYLNGTVDGETIIIGKIYMTKYNAIVTGDVSVPLDRNTAITLTSTTGTDKLFVQINYVVELV